MCSPSIIRCRERRAPSRRRSPRSGADLEELRCGRYSPGFGDFLRAAYDSWRGNLPAIEPPAHVPSCYDLVVLGVPVWAWNACTPVRAFLAQEAPELSNAAFW